MRRVNKAGIDLIKSFEGLFKKPYLCPANVPTIGYGTIQYPNGKKVTMADREISEKEAEAYLIHEVEEKSKAVEKMCKVPLNDNEFAALTSFSYNVGSRALETSTLMKLLNAGTNRTLVADQFLRWDKAGGKQLPGLTRRRQAERALFLQPLVESNEMLPSGPTDDEVNDKLKQLEDEIMKK
jgi:lysozyme